MGLLTHCPLGWINFPRKSRVSFKYKSTNGFPFEIKRVNTNPYEALTEQELLDKLKKSREHAEQGMYKEAADVSRDMRAKYGL